MSDIQNTPWLRRKSTLIGGGVVLTAIIFGMALSKSPSAPASSKLKNQSGQTGQAGTSLGTAGQTAEFNQTFAARLRAEQANQAARLETQMQQQLKDNVAQESERLHAELGRGTAEINQRLDALIKAQRDAEAQRIKEDVDNPLKFVPPAGATSELSATKVISEAPDSESGGRSMQTTVHNVIPPNGFVKGRLLNGVVATIGENPTAFLVALEGTYKAANGYVVNLNGCMATVEGRPNLAAGRIDGKPAEITCNFEKDGRVQTWPVAGWLVDAEDGIRGLNSYIVDNTGKKITAAALAQSLAAAGAALNESQFSQSGGTSGVTRTFTGSIGSVVAGGAVAGAGQGLSTAINEHYALYKPSLQKGANSLVTLVITNELPVPDQGSHITQNTNITNVKKQ